MSYVRVFVPADEAVALAHNVVRVEIRPGSERVDVLDTDGKWVVGVMVPFFLSSIVRLGVYYKEVDQNTEAFLRHIRRELWLENREIGRRIRVP